MSLPPVTWAQREDLLYLTIAVPNVVKEDAKVNLETAKLTFEASDTAKHQFKWELEFFGEVNIEESSYNIQPRQVEFKIVKKEKGPYWDRLAKGSQKQHNVKCDWNKWKDEDEEADDSHLAGFGGGMDFGNMMGGMGGMPGMGGMGGMPGMGGMGGMPGMDFGGDDSDDEDDDAVPGLEEDDGPPPLEADDTSGGGPAEPTDAD
mmetsp:Transcript_63972/g.151314  ORF Transcript_63972/g.151314 Transcript_63972/m.151314 type:complete len:204 (+) Transcript_63972:38-649(+)